MPRDARFWRNVAMVAVAHLIIAIVLVGWSRGTRKLDQPNIVWMTEGLSAGASRNAPPRTESSASEKSRPVATSPTMKRDEREEPVSTPAPAKSEIELPVPTPSVAPVKTPVPQPSATPPPRPTPKRIATPMPRTTRKKTALTKATPGPSTKNLVKHAEVEKKGGEPGKEKELRAASPPSGPGPSGDKSGTNGSGGGAPASEFRWYGKMLHDRFFKEWVQPTTSVPAGAKMSALVRIRIEQDGRISKFNIVRPSGNVVVDESVAAVAKRVTRVEPLPSGLGGAFYEVNINFELNPTK